MWVPDSAAQLEAAAREGTIVEVLSLDAKAALPSKGKNVDIAIDVSAMTVDGGVLLYGVAEDDHGRPKIPKPIELAGARERVDQVCQTLIAEPPFIEIVELPCEEDPARGYLVVAVPQSGRAPHQVTARGERRYYGRGDTGNRVLTEGEVARLYRRRDEWEVDQRKLLEDCIAQGPEPRPDRGYLHAFARPVVLQEEMWPRIEPNADALPGAFLKLADAAWAMAPQKAGYSPSLSALAGWRPRGGDAWTLASPSEGVDGVRCDLYHDGQAYLFCGRVAARHERRPDQEPALFIIEQLIASVVLRPSQRLLRRRRLPRDG